MLSPLGAERLHRVPRLSLGFDVSAEGGHEENKIQSVEKVHWLLCGGAVRLHFLADGVHIQE